MRLAIRAAPIHARRSFGETGMSRAGRKRKDGPRHPGGQLKRLNATELEESERTKTARQPHRRALAHQLRSQDVDELDVRKLSAGEEAESPIGRLWLGGHLKSAGDSDSQAARDRYDAGNMFAQVVGAYLSAIEAPGGTSGSGQKSSCQADLLCSLDTDECLCFARRRRYTRAYEALAGGARVALELEAADIPAPLQHAIDEARRVREDEAYVPIAADSRRVVMAVISTVIHRSIVSPEELVYLVRGLETLRQHFGLTTRRKPKQYRNAK
jgi:hypothetical protein